MPSRNNQLEGLCTMNRNLHEKTFSAQRMARISAPHTLDLRLQPLHFNHFPDAILESLDALQEAHRAYTQAVEHLTRDTLKTGPALPGNGRRIDARAGASRPGH